MRAVIGAFASSDEGNIYRIVCDRWGVDPGAIFGDDVEAFLMRQALMLTSPKSPEQVAEVTDVFEEWAASV